MTAVAGSMMTVELPWPDKRLSPNGRVHWGTRASSVLAARMEGQYACMAAGLRKGCLSGTEALRVGVTFHPPDRRRRDDDNMISSCKALRDGVSAFLGVDDSKWVTTYRVAEPRKGGAVIVHMEAA